MSVERRHRAASVAIAAAVVAGALAVWALVAGGFRVQVFGVPLSVRGADRPAIIALACSAIALYLDERRRRRLGVIRRDVSPSRLQLTTVALTAVAVLWIGVTLNYSWLASDWLDRSVEYLQRAGYEPFLLLEDWEVPTFRERFTSQNYVALVGSEPPHAPCTHTTYIYRVVPRPGLPPSGVFTGLLDCRGCRASPRYCWLFRRSGSGGRRCSL
jgi:hypothetical protein